MQGDPGRAADESRVERDELAAIVRSAEDAILAKTLDGTITNWNAAAEALYGWTAEEVVGRHISVLVPHDRKDELARIFERLRRGEQVGTFETRRVRKDGTTIEVSLTVSPVKSATGEVIGASAIARDVSRIRQDMERTARLLEVTTALAGAMTVDTVVRATIELATRALEADSGILVLRGSTPDRLKLAATIGYERDTVGVGDEWPIDLPLPVNEAVRTGRLVAVDATEVATTPQSVLAPLLAPETRTIVAVPLTTEGPPIGSLGLRFRQTRTFNAADRDFMRSLGGQCAIALERARLYEAERMARDRLTLLSEAGEEFAASLDVEETLATLSRLAVPRLADWCGVALRHDDGTVRRYAIHHRDPEREAKARQAWAGFPFDAGRSRGMAQVLKTGEPELTPRVTAEALAAVLPSDELEAIRALGVESSIVVPLRARGRTMGAAAFISATPGRHYGEADLSLAEELARRAAMALDNARLFSDRSHVARKLQESLLPRVLPAIPGVELGARYVAAGEGNEVGGDFYDVFAAGPGRWAVVIGDVCGKGADAAGVTALARYTIRALASHSAGTAGLLADLNSALVTQAEEGTVPLERFITLAYALADPGPAPGGGMRLSVALAGHPRPYVLRAGGAVEAVGVPGSLLGVFPSIDVAEATVHLAAGEAVVFYTDGVTEARGRDGLFGDDRLREVLARCAVSGKTDPDLLADAVAVAVAAHRGGDGAAADADDMAVLVLRVSGCATL